MLHTTPQQLGQHAEASYNAGIGGRLRGRSLDDAGDDLASAPAAPFSMTVSTRSPVLDDLASAPAAPFAAAGICTDPGGCRQAIVRGESRAGASQALGGGVGIILQAPASYAAALAAHARGRRTAAASIGPCAAALLQEGSQHAGILAPSALCSCLHTLGRLPQRRCPEVVRRIPGGVQNAAWGH